jgi:hypothetical protein
MAVTIDETIGNRNVTIIQLDVEGYEHNALEGAKETIERCKPIIIVEKVLKSTWFCDHLGPLGYTPFQSVHNNTVYTADRGTRVAMAMS